MSNTKWEVHVGAGAAINNLICNIQCNAHLHHTHGVINYNNTVSVQDQIDLDQTSVDHQSFQDCVVDSMLLSAVAKKDHTNYIGDRILEYSPGPSINFFSVKFPC